MRAQAARSPVSRLHDTVATRARGPSIRRGESAPLTRDTAAGAFSIPYGTVRVAAEPGLVVKVHAGLLWVPNHEEHCSVGLGAGEHMVVGTAGELQMLANRTTEVELRWPGSRLAGASTAH